MIFCDFIAAGLKKVLHYTTIIYYFQESPLTSFTSFLHRCIRHHNFDSETTKLLISFLQHAQRKYSVGASGAPWQLSKEGLQRVSVSLVKIALSHNFDSAYHQREFLKCLAVHQFGKGFTGTNIVPTAFSCFVNL